MKSTTGSPRKRTRPSEVISPVRARQLDKHLRAYALASAGMVALTPEASAEIVYTPAHILLTHGVLQIDLNHDGITDFTIRDHANGSSSSYIGSLNIGRGLTPPGAGVLGQERSDGLVQVLALPPGSPIGPESPQPFFELNRRWASMAYQECSVGGCVPFGFWAKASNKFLGLRFLVDGEVHYGWARFSVSTQYWPIHARFTGYAYETEPNKTILAGDRGLGPEANAETGHPEDASLKTGPTRQPPSLGLLSLGSIGLAAWRQPRH